MTVSLADIEKAAAVLAGKIVRTPLVPAVGLADDWGVDLHLKLENLQRAGSFKTRGAYVMMSRLPPEVSHTGVIAMSAGNHAQGVAYSARQLGIPATIVMPEQTPFTKVERTRRYGARVILKGETLGECAAHAEEIAAREKLVFVHPYDDPDIIAGQGTIGLEMLADMPDLEVLVVPIGGGGLIGGIATAAKALNPAIEIIGVEASLYPSMHEAINNLPASSAGQTLAEGIAVKQPGVLNREIVARLVDDIILVDESAIERAVQLLIEDQKLVAEGAGAAGIAAIMTNLERFRGRKVGTVICGGNIDSRLLSSVLLRGLARDGKLVRIRCEISDSPGVLAKIAGLIGQCGGNIVEIYHQRLFYNVPVKLAELDAVIETRTPEHAREIMDALTSAGIPTKLLGGATPEGY
ncbi:MAG: threonine ammonia-lyase [Alphaproteobacteria bacterium]|nr:threonine ammonia-lyase [Alphaproteobacteria bacterium]MBU0795983.1 threonine ammonia-lyase [Alphaproteobacteria bacterium]MBU0885671.1 threonine ammonia-lyase [Alphaproteobacteria bacterium]MBU1812673.1 threonine ammonia-lyase [Alphaproteobacteria bacterium]MBU2089710.1 threonine ammonia-lyase [Alphaproteobacteria bacterium]